MSELTEDTIGVIQFEFADWRTRAPAHEIMDAIRAKTADIPGILVEVTAPRAGPPTGKPIQVQLAALDPAVLPAAANKVAALLAARDDIRDLDDGQPLPGIDWKIEVDKSEAAKYGAGVNTVGSAVQLVTNGLKATEYRPVDSDKSVDILVRFPPDRRSLDQIDELRVQTQVGHVPIGNFVHRVPVAARRLHQPRQQQPGDDGLGQHRRGRAGRQGAAGDRRAARQGRSRRRRHLQAQGRGRGAREGGRLPDEGVRHRDLLDLRDPAGAVQQAHLGRPGAHRGGDVDLRRAARAPGDGAAVRRGDDRHRRDRQCRRDREQQHRADRHL